MAALLDSGGTPTIVERKAATEAAKSAAGFTLPLVVLVNHNSNYDGGKEQFACALQNKHVLNGKSLLAAPRQN